MTYVPGLTEVQIVRRATCIGEHDSWLLRQVEGGRRIGPRRVGFGLQMSREEAKDILRSAVERGVLRTEGDGWYRKADAS